jgi:hypothetical protein
MRIKRAVPAAILLSVIAATHVMAQAPGLNRDRARREIGDVVIFNHGLDRLVVAIDTDITGTDGLVDQWFVLQTLLPATETRIHLRDADVVYKKEFVRVTSHQDDKVYEFALEGVDVSPAPNARYDVVRNEGFGLAHNTGDTTIRLSSDDCAGCESLTQDWGELGDDSGAGTCNAGGIGATSCSLSGGCSVSCTSSHYACCRTLANGNSSCRCYLNP